MRSLDAVIVGAGPGGLVACHRLAHRRVALIEKGADLIKRHCPMKDECFECNRCGEIEGIAGAGGWSDGKLCLGNVGILDEYMGTDYRAEVRQIDDLFRKVLGEFYVPANESVGNRMLTDDTSQEVTEVANIGTSAIRLSFQTIAQRLAGGGVPISVRDKVIDVDKLPDGRFRILTRTGRRLDTNNVLVATGKCDFSLIPKLVKKFNLATRPVQPTLGFRLVAHNSVLRRLKDLGNNPKIKLHLSNGDTIKTHCFCFGGEVMAYICGPYFLVGGRADARNSSDYANVNVLYKFGARDLHEAQRLVHGVLGDIRTAYGSNIVYQNARSFLDGDPEAISTVVPPCRGATLGFLSPFFPDDMLQGFRRFLSMLETDFGLDLTQAAIFGPASEWINEAIAVELDMATTTKGLYIAGDSAGITQGIISAAVTGWRAASAIDRRCRDRAPGFEPAQFPRASTFDSAGERP
jgi:uncharacterized FAD-dependent dehydrogenase